ncbi:phosphate transporter 1 [Prunus dulcis]|uniref:Phosphate transporter 1 n=1 Tax=Prunus dulcis TaxID=3755 RepID=A0A4Y1QKS5_PRUDU|nr:phosphate transporter 1 [Prunus dulcis]
MPKDARIDSKSATLLINIHAITQQHDNIFFSLLQMLSSRSRTI